MKVDRLETKLSGKSTLLSSCQDSRPLEQIVYSFRVHLGFMVSRRNQFDKARLHWKDLNRSDSLLICGHEEKETMKKAIFYHAGCPVCVSAEQGFVNALDKSAYDIELVHLGDNPGRLSDAEAAGVKSVPALVLDGQAFHINFGAGIEDLRK